MVDLGALERAAFNREPDRWAVAVAALGALPGAPQPSPEQAARFAAAIGAIVSDPGADPTLQQFLQAMLYRQELVNLARVSPLGGFDHILRAMGFQPRGGAPAAQAVDLGRLAKGCLLLSLDSDIEFGPDDVLALPPQPAQAAYISFVGSKPIASALGAERREAFVGRADALAPAPMLPSINALVALSSAWMLCSYASHPRKHQIKAVLNRTLVDFAGRIGIAAPDLSAERRLKDRPRMLVAAEIMNSTHVQYRYFGQYLRQLRERFELVLLTEEREADPATRALFDRTLTFRRGARGEHLAEIGGHMAQAAADIVFWPSVGMRHWGPLFANLRYAPIQMTALGHSASTFCPAIDYYLTEEGYVSDPALFGERLLLLPDDSLMFERSPHYEPTPPTVRETAKPLKVALPSNLLKLNPNFIAVLGRIREQASRELEFHVFPNSDGSELRAIRWALARSLPGAQVHGRIAYNRYLQLLSACDLNLSPFPFGGLHSVIDSLRQGLPVVAMECPEPHGRTDAMLLRRLGMPGWLVAKDEAEYVAAALRIIDDDAQRVALARQALALDIDRLMFGDASTPRRSEVVDAVWWAYRNHDRLVADDRRVVRPADWAIG